MYHVPYQRFAAETLLQTLLSKSIRRSYKEEMGCFRRTTAIKSPSHYSLTCIKACISGKRGGDLEKEMEMVQHGKEGVIECAAR